MTEEESAAFCRGVVLAEMATNSFLNLTRNGADAAGNASGAFLDGVLSAMGLRVDVAGDRVRVLDRDGPIWLSSEGVGEYVLQLLTRVMGAALDRVTYGELEDAKRKLVGDLRKVAELRKELNDAE